MANPNENEQIPAGKFFIPENTPTPVFIDRRSSTEYVLGPTGDVEDDFVVQLRKLNGLLELESGVQVVYPGSNTHVGVARVFGKKNVVHVDPDEGSMSALAKAGYRTVISGIEDFHPVQPADVLVALNSYGAPSSAVYSRVLKEGGIVIANDYTGWATETNELPDTKLIGAIMPAYNYRPEYVLASDLPDDAPSSREQTYYLGQGGQLHFKPPETGEYTHFTDPSPAYPDALFVFERL